MEDAGKMLCEASIEIWWRRYVTVIAIQRVIGLNDSPGYNK